jgi:hypothetical protein
MRISRLFVRFVPLVLPLMLGSGCVTKGLWANGNLEAWNQPADKTNLRLYEEPNRKDLLVVYDEYKERSGATHARAYWLNENEERLEQRRTPDFVSTNSALHLTAVPVFVTPPDATNRPAELYALFTTSEQSFTLYSGCREIRCYRLPQYNDGKGKVEKAVLTPLAITADLSIVGGILGYAYLQGLANEYNPSY